MLMYMFMHSRSIENQSIGYWETNPYFSRGVLSQLTSEQDRGKTHMKASKNRNNVIGEERIAHIRTIVISLGGKLNYVFFYTSTDLYQQMYIVIFGVLILFCY
jgi:hypothetical protein